MGIQKSDEALIPNEPIASSPGRTLDRVYAALRGEYDADLLEDDESSIFMDLFAAYLSRPNPDGDKFVARMRAEGGYVGEDSEGRLVEVLPGGVELVIGELSK